MTALSIKNLSLSMASKTLCHNLNIDFNAGQTWGILGCNGSGKTSLLHTFAGLITPSSGEIYLNKNLLSEVTGKTRAKQLALLLQHYEDHFPSTVLETVLMGRHPYCKKWQWENSQDYEIARQALSTLALNHLENRNITTLSGGERRRLAIAMVLTQQANIYLLDEPTNHLDIKHQVRVLNHFRQLALENKKTIIMALHDINQASHYCDNILLLLEDGDYIAGTCKEVLTESNLAEAFNYPLQKISAEGTSFWMAI